jgi:hypothetical protein
VASSDEDKRLRAELAQGLGYFPATLGAQDVARYREQIAERKAREEVGERDGWGPGGYKWRKWDHLREERRRTEIETQGRASVYLETDPSQDSVDRYGRTLAYVSRHPG